MSARVRSNIFLLDGFPEVTCNVHVTFELYLFLYNIAVYCLVQLTQHDPSSPPPHIYTRAG